MGKRYTLTIVAVFALTALLAPRVSAFRGEKGTGDTFVVTAQTKFEGPAGPARSIVESGESGARPMNVKGKAERPSAAPEGGIVMEPRGKTPAVDVSTLTTLDDVIEKVSDKRIVYVGEYHDQFAHHAVQLQVIKALFRKDPKLAIGMEMFQRPFQKALDDYISGSIDEREFLGKSEYFKRWGYDYNLYKPVLDFARAERIPVIALNVRNEVADKVAKTGMDSLAPDERREVPASLDFSDTGYRDRIREAFGEHKDPDDRNFEFFYEAQVLWDESMAQSIDEYLQKNPDRRMVVMAGQGHLAYGSGIPKRVARRHAYFSSTIICDGDIDRTIADYLVFPEQQEGAAAPKLMVELKETGGRVGVTGLPEGSVAKKAGIRTGDTLLSLGGVPVHSVADVKLRLFYSHHGERIRLTVERRRFLLGNSVMEFDVTLP